MLCIDELGPLGARWYQGRHWSRQRQRPRNTPNYGGQGSCWVFGAFEPATGEALVISSLTRRQSDFIAFLDEVVAAYPAEKLVLILDNLNVHKTVNVRLWNLVNDHVRFLFLPSYSPWLNLIEPWWKTLKNLALKGRNFDTLEAVQKAICDAAAYWNDHRHPYVWKAA